MIKVADIIFEGRKRYYKEDLSERDYLLENTTPYKMIIFDYVLEESAWGEMLRSLCTLLLSLFPMSQEEILSFKCPWSKSNMFSAVKKTNFKLVGQTLYINCNHTALHSCWLIQDLLDFYKIDKTNVSLLIHRPSGAESNEVKEYITSRVRNEFIIFLQYAHDKTREYSNKVANNIESYLNPILCSISKSYVSFFLFDDYALFASYSSKVKEKVDKNVALLEKTKNIIYKYLLYLSEYYKV